MLNDIYKNFDSILDHHDVYKVSCSYSCCSKNGTLFKTFSQQSQHQSSLMKSWKFENDSLCCVVFLGKQCNCCKNCFYPLKLCFSHATGAFIQCLWTLFQYLFTLLDLHLLTSVQTPFDWFSNVVFPIYLSQLQFLLPLVLFAIAKLQLIFVQFLLS